jgi:hypothetical protein
MRYYVNAHAQAGGNGSDIVFDEDILGEKRTIKTVAGPFANWGKANRLVY